jgi:hypothetical protein
MNEADTCRKQVVPLLTGGRVKGARHRATRQQLQPRPQESARQGGRRPLPPEQIVASILEKEQRIAEIMGRIQKLLVRSAES